MRAVPLKKVLGALLLASVFLVGSKGVVSANLVSNLRSVRDDFKKEFVTPDANLPQDYWWRTLKAQGATGFEVNENVDCSNSACLTREQVGDERYAKFSLSPQQYPGNIAVSDLTEERNGYSYNTVHRWSPTVNHPVTVTAEMKYSEGYKSDGSGDAVGSSPFWLWNNPLGPTGYIAPIKSMGFNWTDGQTFGGFYKGFKATVVDNSFSPFPIYTVDLPQVNMNDWFTATFIWSVNPSGVQSVDFYVNGTQVGTTTVPVAFPALTTELSVDNQSAQIGMDGSYSINFRNPVREQSMLIRLLKISNNGLQD
jgi:hypothetical protein